MNLNHLKKAGIDEITKKIIVILILTLMLLIPLNQVENQISERQNFESIAVKQIEKGWGENVFISAPILISNDLKNFPAVSETLFEIESKEKKRGVFKVPIYLATYKSKVTFNKATGFINENRKQLSFDEKKTKEEHEDYVFINIRPFSSIESIKITEVLSGKILKAKFVEGGVKVTASVLNDNNFSNKEIQIEFKVRGMKKLHYESHSDQDKIKMSGNWKRPKFIDDILPSETKVTSNGFEANWNFNTLPQWDGEPRKSKTIGLEHLLIGADYPMVERSLEYAILFIALTFMFALILEFSYHVKIHPFQYGLIGLSMSLFYLLLLAFSEVVGFDIAYFISALSIVGLNIFYIKGFVFNVKLVKYFAIKQVILTSYFYVLLSLEENALLIGSIGLFLALALLMTLTRKLDCYRSAFNPNKVFKEELS